MPVFRAKVLPPEGQGNDPVWTGPARSTYDLALQDLGKMKYDDPNDETPARYTIDESAT